MANRNARLNVVGRRLLVHRVRMQGWPVAHAARAMGISRQCAHRWVTRFDVEGLAGLEDRSSRPHRSPNRTSPEVGARVIEARRQLRVGPDRLGPELGVAPRTVTRILRRHGLLRLFEYRPHCPWQNGTVERFNRTLQVEWAYRQVFITNDQRSHALPAWLDDYNYRRRHNSLGGKPPASRLSPT